MTRTARDAAFWAWRKLRRHHFAVAGAFLKKPRRKRGQTPRRTQ